MVKIKKISLFFFTLFFISLNSHAHKSNLGLLHIITQNNNHFDQSVALTENEEAFAHRYKINWAFTGKKANHFPSPNIPDFCSQKTVNRINRTNNTLSETYTIQCKKSLLDTTFSFKNTSLINQIVFLWEAGDSSIEKIYTKDPIEPKITHKDFVTNTPEKKLSRSFLLLGIEHMMFGWDHVLFIIMLFLIIGFNLQLIYAITGFTIGHSITLILATYKKFVLPGEPVEALIALSIVYMSVELINNKKGDQMLVRKFPIAVALGFGLLHGLGFADSLSDLVLRQDLSFIALLTFNLGVEIAQIIWVCFLIFLTLLVTHIIHNKKFMLAGKYLLVYLSGILASYWFVERVSFLFYV